MRAADSPGRRSELSFRSMGKDWALLAEEAVVSIAVIADDGWKMPSRPMNSCENAAAFANCGST
jgi:hypothetical protein